MNPSFLRVPAGLAWLVSLSGAASAQCTQQKLLASNPSQGAWFGFSVSVDGPTAVVGAHQGGGNTPESGAAYVYQRSGQSWAFTQKLGSTTTGDFDAFGLSISLSEKTVAIGSLRDDTSRDDSGVVFVFEKGTNGWVQTARLIASDPAPGMRFGSEVALQGDRLVIGAPALQNTERPGRVYVFERSAGTWTETTKFDASDPGVGDEFGFEVQQWGERILVGATHAVVGGAARGAAYVFDRIGGIWTETAILSASDGAADDRFGLDMEIENKRALIGASSHNQHAGAAYLFEELDGTWTQVRKFTQPAPAQPFAGFGAGTALRGDLAIIGAPRRDGMADIDRGAAYVYRRMTNGAWLLTDELLPNPTRSYFADGIDISGDTVFISAHGDGSFNRGACYAIGLGADFANYCVGLPNSTGVGCTIGWTGSPSITANAFTLTASGAPANRYGQFAYGNQTAQVPFGNGRQCIAGSMFELETPVLTDASGHGALALDFTLPPLSGGAGTVLAGTTWFFQFAYLDPAGGGAGFNLSNGLCATFCP